MGSRSSEEGTCTKVEFYAKRALLELGIKFLYPHLRKFKFSRETPWFSCAFHGLHDFSPRYACMDSTPFIRAVCMLFIRVSQMFYILFFSKRLFSPRYIYIYIPRAQVIFPRFIHSSVLPAYYTVQSTFVKADALGASFSVRSSESP